MVIYYNVCLIKENWTAKVGRQEIPGVTDKFGLGVKNEEEQRLTRVFAKKTHWS